MTWWETEQMASYISELELRLDEWSMSNSEMRLEQHNIDRVEKKLSNQIAQTHEQDKRVLLKQFANRIEELRQHIIERLKRDIPS